MDVEIEKLIEPPVQIAFPGASETIVTVGAFIWKAADANVPKLPLNTGEVEPIEILYPTPLKAFTGIVSTWTRPVVLPPSLLLYDTEAKLKVEPRVTKFAPLASLIYAWYEVPLI